MKLLSYNVRGVGGVKWKFLKKLIMKEEVQFMCVQETKKEVINEEICHAMWGDAELQWVYQPTNNKCSRGVTLPLV